MTADEPQRLHNVGLKPDMGETHPDGPQPSIPAKRKRGRPPGSKNKPKTETNGISYATPDDALPRSIPPETPKKSRKTVGDASNADRSARRKSARTLIERSLGDGVSDDEDVQGEDALAQRIWAADEDEMLDEGLEDDMEAEESAPVTPSKRRPGRPKGSGRKRSPEPPRDLPAHEQFFYQNRTGGVRTSNNTLSSLSLLNHDEYFALTQNHVDPHGRERDELKGLHSRSFAQWRFELSEGFNICLYGLGSKRKLVLRFAQWLDSQPKTEKQRQIVVVNGYVPNLSIRDILRTLAGAILSPGHVHELGNQPGEMLESLLSLSTGKGHTLKTTLIIHSIDSPALRRASTQSILGRLASHGSIHVVATADHPSFPLLWDSSLREAYNFLFHDCTTFDPYEVEVDVVESVHELLGRSGRRIGGKEGVAFVLKSLTENARSLYRVLIGEQLAGIEDGITTMEADDEAEDRDHTAPSRMQGGGGGGVEYRVLYQKAIEEFICGDEMSFRTLLKE